MEEQKRESDRATDQVERGFLSIEDLGRILAAREKWFSVSDRPEIHSRRQ